MKTFVTDRTFAASPAMHESGERLGYTGGVFSHSINTMTGLIPAARMQRLGTETAFEVLARAEALAREGKDIINLGIGQPDFKTPEHIVEAAVKALRDGHHGYTPAPGIPLLREAVSADLYKRHGVSVNADHVVVVPGGKVTMNFAITMFGEPGAEILYPNPGFPIYESMINFSGAEAVPYALLEEQGFAFDADALLALVNERTRLIILNSPANPTGGIVPKAVVDRLVEGLLRFPNVAILSDEIYSCMLFDDQPHVSLLQYPELAERVIMLDGWSKTYAMTGWRLGYAVWPASLVEHASRLAVNCHSCVNAASQYAGVAALQGDQSAVLAMVRAFDERRGVVVEGLNAIEGVRCQMPGGAFYVFPNITGTGQSSQQLQRQLLEDSGVATIAGTSFGAYGEGYLRISYANSLENIQAALQRVRAAIESQ